MLRHVESGSGIAQLEAAARKLGETLYTADVRHPEDIEGAFAAMKNERVGGVIIMGGPLTFMRRQQIAELELRHRMRAIHSPKEYARAGLLMTNGPSLEDKFRRAARYVGSTLRGAKPAELPVEQPARFELVVNRKTARALRMAIPQSLLLRADEVIR